MPKKIILGVFAIMLVITLAACSNQVGHEKLLAEVKAAEPVGETENWVMESRGYTSSSKEIKAVYDSMNIDYKPQMYIGYQISPDGVNYAFTAKDNDTEHLVIIQQVSKKELKLIKDTTEFDMLDYFQK